MGYMVELNTLLRPPESFDFSSLTPGSSHTVTLDRERAFPLHIAVLVVDKEWNFYGYAKADNLEVVSGKTTITFEMLTVFSAEETMLYRSKFLEAAKKTGEV
ncbi:hypothetical protein HZB58_03490 [Candidatus Gottesmanbacteria bacterium]|nr:hypothetical protein [Candidatus Gottesmanbacteria bacterium]